MFWCNKQASKKEKNFLKDQKYLVQSKIGRLHMTSHISRQKNWLIKSSNLCWKGIGRTPTFGVILKTNKKLIKIWNELLLVGFSETNKFDQKQFGRD